MSSLLLGLDRAVEAWLHACDSAENAWLLHSKADRGYKPQPAGRMRVSGGMSEATGDVAESLDPGGSIGRLPIGV
jgi:hypothetical protein